MATLKRVVLIGYRGSGKSTLGKYLQTDLSWEYICTDTLIQKRVGKSIIEIVAEKGWQNFREIETQIISGLSSRGQCIIDCGGGIIEHPPNMVYLKNQSLVVWVNAELEDILDRLRKDQTRPHISEHSWEKDLITHYHRREDLYRRYSHLDLNTSRLSVEECAELIRDALGNSFPK